MYPGVSLSIIYVLLSEVELIYDNFNSFLKCIYIFSAPSVYMTDVYITVNAQISAEV